MNDTTIYITFGQKYRRQRYPRLETLPFKPHPDGWLAVKGPSADACREHAIAVLGPYWAMMYEEKPSKDFFPMGELHCIEMQ